MKKNIIVLPKEKLISIDGIIPLLLELKAKHLDCNIIFILPSRDNLALIKKNTHLWQCIETLNVKYSHSHIK